MKPRVDNYQIQASQAKKLFLTYDQQELIQRCKLRFDEDWLYAQLLSQTYRISRQTGDMERLKGGRWVDGNSFNGVMTILDWLCDSKPYRSVTGRWVNLATHGPVFHGGMQDGGNNPVAALFDRQPEAFSKACLALGGVQMSGPDLGYVLEVVDGLQVFVQLWFGDDEFAPRLRILWDENAEQYLRYETTWYTAALLQERIMEYMEVSG